MELPARQRCPEPHCRRWGSCRRPQTHSSLRGFSWRWSRWRAASWRTRWRRWCSVPMAGNVGVSCGHCRCRRTSPLRNSVGKNVMCSNTKALLQRENVICFFTYRQRAGWRWWPAGTQRGPGCSSSWSWRWGACHGRKVYVAAETRWVAQWPEQVTPECPWWGWPKASGRPSKESPASGEEPRGLIWGKKV